MHFDLVFDFMKPMKKFWYCFFTFLTWGEDGEEGRTQIKIFSSKKQLKTCYFKIFVFWCDAHQGINLLSSRTLSFLFHKGWKCVLTLLTIVASAWINNFWILILFSIFWSRWKKFVIVFLHFSLGGKMGRRGAPKLKFSARKKNSKPVILK